MKNDREEQAKNSRRALSPPEKINTLLADLLEKEKQISMYKNRLKELETAFYYNLELISERDLELSILEKQLCSEKSKLQDVAQERDELEDLIKMTDDKNSRKIQQLETRLTLKDEEIRELQRENARNVTSLKRTLEVAKGQEMKIHKLSINWEMEKKDLRKSCCEEMEDKEKYFLLELDNLTRNLEQACRAKDNAEEEKNRARSQLADAERVFQEKESRYLEEIRKTRRRWTEGVHKEVQCGAQSEVGDKKIQAEPESTAAESQTLGNVPEAEQHYKKRVAFLQEQNEVLKCVIKDLKKNRDSETHKSDDQRLGEGGGCRECSAVREEVHQLSQRVGTEINNFRKILETEQRQRAEEEEVVQSLESNVSFLKAKLLARLQESLQDFSGEEDICSYTYNREIQTEIQVSLLEEKLGKKIDSLTKFAEEEREKVNQKLEEFKRDCLEKLEKHLKQREEPPEMQSENLLEQIRTEIQKLESKIESDMKNMVRNNSEKNKCDKNFQTGAEGKTVERTVFPEVLPPSRFTSEEPLQGARIYYRNDFSPEKCISVMKCGRDGGAPRKRSGDQKAFRRVTNDLLLGR